MLEQYLIALRDAENEKEKSKIYSDLAKLGMDKMTADILVKEI